MTTDKGHMLTRYSLCYFYEGNYQGNQCAVHPPSTNKLVPVTMRDKSDAR